MVEKEKELRILKKKTDVWIHMNTAYARENFKSASKSKTWSRNSFFGMKKCDDQIQQCYLCGRNFKTVELYTEHYRVVHWNKPQILKVTNNQ